MISLFWNILKALQNASLFTSPVLFTPFYDTAGKIKERYFYSNLTLWYPVIK